MIIDDNQTHLGLSAGLFGRIFEEEEIFPFNSATEAIEELAKESDDSYLIFLDMHMPEVDGWGFLEKYDELNRVGKDDKVFMLSAAIEPSLREKARNHSLLDGFISKPLTFYAITAVRDHLLKKEIV